MYAWTNPTIIAIGTRGAVIMMTYTQNPGHPFFQTCNLRPSPAATVPCGRAVADVDRISAPEQICAKDAFRPLLFMSITATNDQNTKQIGNTPDREVVQRGCSPSSACGLAQDKLPLAGIMENQRRTHSRLSSGRSRAKPGDLESILYCSRNIRHSFPRPW